MDGYIWRKERGEEKAAFWMAKLLNMFGKTAKKNITPAQLIAQIRPKKAKDKQIDAEELKKLFPDKL